jgi:hypothetical protein
LQLSKKANCQKAESKPNKGRKAETTLAVLFGLLYKKKKNSNEGTRGIFSHRVLCNHVAATPFGIGIYSLVIALPSRNTHIGTLIRARTWEYCNKGCGWRVVDVFQKGNGSRTCEIERKEEYKHESRANHVVERTVLGTQKRIWEYRNDARHCYDERIRKSSFQTAVICLSIVAFFICCPIVSLCTSDQTNPNDSFGRDDEVNTGGNVPAENTPTANTPTEDLGCDVGRDGYKLTLVFDIESAESEPIVHLA